MNRLSILRRGALPLSLLALFGCDSTVALDTTLPSLRDVYVSGVCPVEGSDDQLALSVVLLSQNENKDKSANLLPTDRVQKERKNVGELLKTDSFTFSLPSIAAAEVGDIDGVAYMTHDDDPSAVSSLAINPLDVSFDYVAGEEGQSASPYVIFVMDQSSSHIGQTSSEIVLNKATDSTDQRISFFTQVIKNLPESYYASIISYRGNFDDAQETDNPTNIPLSLNPSQKYEYEEDGVARKTSGEELLTQRLRGFTVKANLEFGSPRIKALKSAYELATEAIASPPANSNGLRPVVVLYTDGVEDGDSSGLSDSLSDIAALYAAADIPVHVVHLNLPITFDPSERLRDQELAELACATRGDYLFVQNSKSFSESKTLQPILNNRIDGRWKLTLESTLNTNSFPGEQGYLFNSALQVTLGAETKTYSIAKAMDGSPSKDQRVWIFKN